MYIYLDNVDLNTSPLFLIKDSHRLGATKFPHNLTINSENKKVLYKYKKNKLIKKIEILEGCAGSISYCHKLIFHGTQPHKDNLPEFLLEYWPKKIGGAQ